MRLMDQALQQVNSWQTEAATYGGWENSFHIFVCKGQGVYALHQIIKCHKPESQSQGPHVVQACEGYHYCRFSFSSR